MHFKNNMLTVGEVHKFIDDFDQSGLNISSISAQTGTGKSTMFPQGFYQRGKTMFVVQPTITASTGLAKYMKTRIPSTEIGTAVEGDIKYKNSKLYFQHESITPLVYCTAGHLRNILLRFGETGDPIAFVDYIFLDEAHTGDLQYDMIMYMYRYLVEIVKKRKGEEDFKGNPIGLPRLILITATPGVYPFQKKEIYPSSYPGESFPVKLFYHPKDYETLKGKKYKDLFEDTVAIVKRFHEENPLNGDETDGWLVFCPGKNEIKDVVLRLTQETKGTIIIPLYSSMTEESEIAYDEMPPPGFRKIIVSTNVAEASITINGLTGVFDTLVEKTTVSGKNGGVMLATTNISASSARQRKGRAGRTREGFCYRMCTENFFNKLKPVRPREIERISPDGLILDIISRDLKVEDIIVDGSISKKTLSQVIQRLSLIGLLSSDGKKVTVAGEFAKKTPLSPRMAMFFWLWAFHGEFNPYIGAVITAVIEIYGQGFFFIPENEDFGRILLEKYNGVLQKFRTMKTQTSLRFNIEVMLSIISAFQTIDIAPGLLVKYCNENNLNNQRVKECLKLTRYLIDKRSSRPPIIIGKFLVEKEVEKCIPFLYQCYQDLLFKEHDKKYNVASELDEIPVAVKTKASSNKKQRLHSYVIPLSFFETEFKTFVSLFDYIDEIPLAKISPPIATRQERLLEKEETTDQSVILDD